MLKENKLVIPTKRKVNPIELLTITKQSLEGDKASDVSWMSNENMLVDTLTEKMMHPMKPLTKEANPVRLLITMHNLWVFAGY